MNIVLNTNKLNEIDSLFNDSLIIKNIEINKNEVILNTEPCEFVLSYVSDRIYNDIFNALKNISDEFLPKMTWDKTIYQMAVDGLKSGKWTGIAYFNNDLPISYMDFKKRTDGFIEIGIMYTDTDYRGLGLASSLIRWLILLFPQNDIVTGTYENNSAMRKCFENIGFDEVNRITDRIDGTDSIYYRKNKILLEV
jgi:GNAT superfamily N-acetyltransferase